MNALAGLILCSTAQRHPLYLLRGESPLGVENILHLTLQLVSRFPFPVPAEIRVPHWAILDVTVCLIFFSLLRHCNHNTFQQEANWDSEKARQTGGEHRRPYLPFPLLFTVSHPRLI